MAKDKTYKEIALEMVEEAMQEETEKKSKQKILVETCSCKRRRNTRYANNLRRLREGEFYQE